MRNLGEGMAIVAMTKQDWRARDSNNSHWKAGLRRRGKTLKQELESVGLRMLARKGEIRVRVGALVGRACLFC
jgi:hypothetical protein